MTSNGSYHMQLYRYCLMRAGKPYIGYLWARDLIEARTHARTLSRLYVPSAFLSGTWEMEKSVQEAFIEANEEVIKQAKKGT